jgi:hypothetical protein
VIRDDPSGAEGRVVCEPVIANDPDERRSDDYPRLREVTGRLM